MDRFHFKKTNEACPEQYDVFNADGKQVGYLRLRWGNISLKVPDHKGKEIYTENLTPSDRGVFKSETERNAYIKRCGMALAKYYEKEKK